MDMAAKTLIKLAVLAVAASGAALWGANYWHTGRYLESTDNAYVRADIAAISPRIAGEVVEVLVENNQTVKKGEALLRIDPRDYQAKLANAKAMVAQAEAALITNQRTQEMQGAMIDEASASLSAAQAEQGRSEKEYNRATSLVKDGVATIARLDIATAAAKAAEASVGRGQAGVRAARTQVSTLQADRARLQAQIDAARAAEQLAELDLEATTLRAPADARVGDLAVKLGERVVPGRRLLSLVSTGTVWVEANFKETQLTHMTVGQPVEVKVDAYPDAPLSGTVQSLSPASGAEFALLPPDNATGNFTKIVQRVPVKVALKLSAEQQARLRSGMSVEAVINTKPGA